MMLVLSGTPYLRTSWGEGTMFTAVLADRLNRFESLKINGAK